ncbi:unnamed protein product [Ixodes pacificus]
MLQCPGHGGCHAQKKGACASPMIKKLRRLGTNNGGGLDDNQYSVRVPVWTHTRLVCSEPLSEDKNKK